MREFFIAIAITAIAILFSLSLPLAAPLQTEEGPVAPKGCTTDDECGCTLDCLNAAKE